MVCKKCKKDIPDDAALCCYCGRVIVQKRRHTRRANNTGSVYKLPGTRKRPWAAWKDGVLLDTCETKTAAEELLNSVTHLHITDRFNMTTEEVYGAWKLERAGMPLFTGSWGHIPPKIRKSKVRQLRAADYQGIIDAMVKEDFSRATCDKVKQLLNFLSRWSMREDLIVKNYAEFIRLPKADTEGAVPFSDEDITKLKAHDADPDVKAVLIMIYSGWRISEFLHLKRRDIHLEEGYMVGGSKTDAGKNRIVPIIPSIREHVRYFLEHPRDGFDGPQAPFLQNEAGRVYDRNMWTRKHFKRALAVCGITEHYTPHSTRHTFASLAPRAGVPREALKQILGHKKYETTANIYMHANIAALRDAAGLIEEIETSNKPLTSTLEGEKEETL